MTRWFVFAWSFCFSLLARVFKIRWSKALRSYAFFLAWLATFRLPSREDFSQMLSLYREKLGSICFFYGPQMITINA